jgi:hypothetical protein
MRDGNPLTTVKRCGATTRAGTPCQQPAVSGRERCRMHGGTQAIGFANQNFKHGLFSKYLPARLLPVFRAAKKNEDRLVLDEKLALLDARIADLLTRVDTGESGALWLRARRTFTAFKRAQADRDVDTARLLLDEHDAILSAGATDTAAWIDLRATIADYRRLVAVESKRRTDEATAITVEQMLAVVATMTEIVRRHVEDRAALAAIAADVYRLLGAPDLGGSVSARELPYN